MPSRRGSPVRAAGTAPFKRAAAGLLFLLLAGCGPTSERIGPSAPPVPVVDVAPRPAEAQPSAEFAVEAKVAKEYYALVREAERLWREAYRREPPQPLPDRATGVVLDRRGSPVAAAMVVVDADETDEVPGRGKTDARGRFEIAFARKDYQGLSLTVTAEGFPRWALGGIYGGIADHRVRLDREIDEQYMETLTSEKDPERRLWMLLEVIGERQMGFEVAEVFPYIGELREDLLRVIESGAFVEKDSFHNRPSQAAMDLLAYWCDAADEAMVRRRASRRFAREDISGATVEETLQRLADHHFGGKDRAARPPSGFSKPVYGPAKEHAFVRFFVEYAVWGYSMELTLVKRGGKWELKLVADYEHWDKMP